MSRRSYWAHTFSSGAHSVAVRGREVYATWYDVRSGDSDVIFAKSTDGGLAFGPNARVNDDRGKAKQYKPSLGVDAAGVIYILWRDDRRGHADIFFARSEDEGKSFSKNRRLNDDKGWAYQGNPALGVSPEGHVYAAWSDNRNGQDDIYFTVSRDKGRTFGRNIRLNDDKGRAVQSHPTVGAGPDGLVMVAWEDFRDGQSEIYLARSTDGGKTFEPNRSLSSQFTVPASPLPRQQAGAGGHSSQPGQTQGSAPTLNSQLSTLNSIQVSPSITVGPKSEVALAWAEFNFQLGQTQGSAPTLNFQLPPPDAARGETLWWEKVRQGDADIYVAVSTDGGASFSPPLRVNDDQPGSSQAFPSVAIDSQGAIYVAWEDFRNGQADIYFTNVQHSVFSLSSSIQHPVSTHANRKVNDDSGHSRQSHPSLAVDEGGKPYLIWTDGRGNPFVSSKEADADLETEEEGNDVYFTRGEQREGAP